MSRPPHVHAGHQHPSVAAPQTPSPPFLRPHPQPLQPSSLPRSYPPLARRIACLAAPAVGEGRRQQDPSRRRPQKTPAEPKSGRSERIGAGPGSLGHLLRGRCWTGGRRPGRGRRGLPGAVRQRESWLDALKGREWGPARGCEARGWILRPKPYQQAKCVKSRM